MGSEVVFFARLTRAGRALGVSADSGMGAAVLMNGSSEGEGAAAFFTATFFAAAFLTGTFFSAILVAAFFAARLRGVGASLPASAAFGMMSSLVFSLIRNRVKGKCARRMKWLGNSGDRTINRPLRDSWKHGK